MKLPVFGGERGIRTLERVLTVTRFPIVRLRPTQPSLQVFFCVLLSATLIIISLFLKMSISFFKFSHTYFKMEQTFRHLLHFGGERGIRTLERVLTVTRFPIVRLRPTQPSLQVFFCALLPATLVIISGFVEMSSIF